MIYSKLKWKESFLCSLFCIACVVFSYAQNKKFYNPISTQSVKGRLAVLNDEQHLGRLPASLKGIVRDPVWHLGENSAGIYVDFKTSASNIQVRYKLKGALNMPHMPTTGVSGVDLYMFNEKSKSWEWAYGRYTFKDTANYNFDQLGSNIDRTFRLYLPLYNTVEWLEIGVDEKESFQFIKNKQKPIVVYGTSIAQGACVSRPGIAWTNVVGRAFNNEVINLAFSGNGRLEQPILDQMNKEDASVFILDCIPNLSLTKERTKHQLDSLIVNAVTFLRQSHPNTPIVLTAHSSANTPGFMNEGSMIEYGNSSLVAETTFKRLKAKGDKNIYWLSSKDIGFDINSTVDYGHPNDYGMMKLADAYKKLLAKILK